MINFQSEYNNLISLNISIKQNCCVQIYMHSWCSNKKIEKCYINKNHSFHFLDHWFIIFNHEHILHMQIRLSIFTKLKLINSFSESFCNEYLMKLFESCCLMSWWLCLLKTFNNVVFMFFMQNLRSNLWIIFEIRIN